MNAFFSQNIIQKPFYFNFKNSIPKKKKNNTWGFYKGN